MRCSLAFVAREMRSSGSCAAPTTRPVTCRWLTAMPCHCSAELHQQSVPLLAHLDAIVTVVQERFAKSSTAGEAGATALAERSEGAADGVDASEPALKPKPWGFMTDLPLLELCTDVARLLRNLCVSCPPFQVALAASPVLEKV